MGSVRFAGSGRPDQRRLYSELEAEFIKYIENLDEGTSLPYAMEDGKVVTRMSDTVGSYVTGDMTTADLTRRGI